MSHAFRIYGNVSILRDIESFPFIPFWIFFFFFKWNKWNLFSDHSLRSRAHCLVTKTGRDSEKIKIGNQHGWGENMKAYCDWNVKKYYNTVVLVILLFYYCVEVNSLELVGFVWMILIIKRKIWGGKVWLFPSLSILYVKHTVSAIWLHTA